MDNDADFSGSPDEFLAMRSESGALQDGDAAIPTPDEDTPEAQHADAADAADETEAEDDDLSPAERVAAVLAQDAADSGQEPEASAEQTAEAADSEDELPEDLSSLSPEQLLELAKEALDLRAKLAEGDVDREQQQLEAEIADLDTQTVGRVQAAYQREVIGTSEAHYGRLLTEAETQLYARSQEQREVDPQQFFIANLAAVRGPILAAQRTWEAKKAAEWEPIVEAEINAARKQNPKLRQRYAEHLAAEHKLPRKAAEELLKVQNTDDMPVVAQSLADSVRAHNTQKRQKNQELRDQAAKAVAAAPLTAPATGRAKPPKPVELKGDAEEFLDMKRRGMLSTV